MSYSFTFDSTDLSAYELVVTAIRVNKRMNMAFHIQMKDSSHPVVPQRLPREISLEVDVIGTSRSDLDDNLDVIKRIIIKDTPKQLILDAQNDRYYEAILENISGDYESAILFRGTLDFVCPDPDGHDVTETTSGPHTIDETPETIAEVTGGSGDIRPVYTITATGDMGAITVKLEVTNTGEELTWVGTLDTADELEIDTALWIVNLNSVADMADVSGQFPRLLASVSNSIKVTGCDDATLDIVYRNRYL